MNKSCTFNEWLLNKDEELYQEMKLANAFRGAVAGGLIGLSTLGGNPESPVDKIRNQNDAFVKQHDAFMKDHNRKAAKMDKHIDALSAKKNAEEDDNHWSAHTNYCLSLVCISGCWSYWWRYYTGCKHWVGEGCWRAYCINWKFACCSYYVHFFFSSGVGVERSI